MAEEKTFRYGFIVLGFFLVMTGMFIMSVEKPQIYITFCTLGVLLVAVGITWSMCQCYPKITFVPVDPEAERFLDHKPFMLPEKDTRALLGWPSHPARGLVTPGHWLSDAELCPLPHSPPCSRSPPGPAMGAAPLASLLEDMDTPSLEGSVPSSPVPRGRPPPYATRSGCTPTSSPAGGEHPSSPRKGTREEDDLYYGLREGPDTLLEDSDRLFEPEN
ncbi:BSND protein, partial [Alopecoenas beccarii]|nr:BSND protein [Alopecoenas beccarii]